MANSFPGSGLVYVDQLAVGRSSGTSLINSYLADDLNTIQIRAESNTSGVVSYTGIAPAYLEYYRNIATGVDLTIQTKIQAAGSGGAIVFSPNSPSADLTPVERMRITKAGNVGIGTSSPNSCTRVQIDVAGSGCYGLMINKTDTNESTIRFKSTHGCGSDYRIGASIYVDSAFEIAQQENGCSRFVIRCTGNVGIGTYTPTSKLDIGGADGRIQSRVDSSDGSTINVRPNAGKCGWISYTEDAVADRWGIGVKNGDAKLYFASGNVGSGGGTTRMVLDGTGNVGIGTCSPSTRLAVEGSGTDIETVARFNNQVNCTTRVWLRNSSHSAYWGVSSTITADTLATGMIAGAMTMGLGNNYPIQFWNGSTATVKMTIDNCGAVGINTTSPGSYKLNVNGAFYSAGSSCEYKTSICQYNTDSCMFMKLKPVTYQYKDEWCHLGKELKSGTQIGLIAEDTAEVFPELAILKDEEEQKVVRNVDYEKLSIILLSEVQKLRKEVDNLKNNK